MVLPILHRMNTANPAHNLHNSPFRPMEIQLPNKHHKLPNILRHHAQHTHPLKLQLTTANQKVQNKIMHWR